MTTFQKTTHQIMSDWIFEEIDKRAPGLGKLERYGAYYLTLMAHDNFSDAGATEEVDAMVWVRGQQNIIEEALQEPRLLKAIGAYFLEASIHEGAIPGGPFERAIDQALEVIKPIAIASGHLTEAGLDMYGLSSEASK